MGDSATSNGAVNQDEPSAYQILNQYHSQPSQIKVIGVGAGAAGILLAYKLQKTLKDVSLTIYEKDVGIGGTWIENRYPGVACDVPAHIYTYPFEPNPEWDFFYASGEQIRQYFEGFAKKYGLNRYFQLNSRVKSAVWDEEKGTYNVEVETPNGLLKDWCHVLTNGTGFLNNWKWPDIHGLSSFKGAKAHSANWDPSTKYDGKRVGVIGTGSSAIQIVPQVQKRAKHLTAFMRSETWISPPVGGQLLEELKRTNAAGNQVAAMGQYKYSEAEKEKFRKDPSSLLAHRKQLETSVNSMFEMFIAGSEVSQQVEKMMREEMLRRIGPAREELKAKLIPKWPPGCRRLTPGDGYLEALVQPNVTTVHSEIDRIIPEGVVDSTGKVHELDVLICATGFEIAFAPPFKLIGEAGVSMQNEWNPEPHCYLALAAPKFPNYFVINGPRGNWGSGCVLPTVSLSVNRGGELCSLTYKPYSSKYK